jgi:hypothetical protein
MSTMNSSRSGCLLALLRVLGRGPRSAQAPAAIAAEAMPAEAVPAATGIVAEATPTEGVPATTGIAAEAGPTERPLPYRVSDRFLSRAEASFYRVLVATTQKQFLICPKVTLGEIFFVLPGPDDWTWRNQINRKSVDFLLCDPATLRPCLGLELDDASHTHPKRQARDAFVDRVFATAGLPLLRVRARAGYDTHALQAEITAALEKPAPIPQGRAEGASESPLCPKCNSPMVLRTVQQGARAGSQFYGCSNFPDCRGTRDLAAS